MKRKLDFITVLSVVLLLLVLTVAFVLVPDKTFSQKENRTLAKLPSFSVSALISGDYTADLAEYISDQFAFRDEFVAVKAYSELLQSKGENNGIIYAGDTLIARDDIKNDLLEQNINTVSAFQKATGVPVCLGILPRKIDVFAEKLPDTYPSQNNKTLWQRFYTQADKHSLTAPRLYDELCEQNNYYRTDHHYTTMGAYSTYKMLANNLGYTPKPIEFFSQKTVSNSFCGTDMRTSGFYLAKKDEITLFRYDGDDSYSITADGKKIDLYDMSRLDTTDQYAVFLGGNHARVDVKKEGQPRQKLLVIRDSFADSIAPFLAIHYDLVMLDLRYFTDSTAEIIATEKIDRVLILESISEFATSKNISFLRKGLQ